MHEITITIGTLGWFTAFGLYALNAMFTALAGICLHMDGCNTYYVIIGAIFWPLTLLWVMFEIVVAIAQGDINIR